MTVTARETMRVNVRVMRTAKVKLKETVNVRVNVKMVSDGTSNGLNVGERINNSSGSRSERNCKSESDRKGQQQ